jgi:hypothetical protein
MTTTPKPVVGAGFIPAHDGDPAGMNPAATSVGRAFVIGPFVGTAAGPWVLRMTRVRCPPAHCRCGTSGDRGYTSRRRSSRRARTDRGAASRCRRSPRAVRRTRGCTSDPHRLRVAVPPCRPTDLVRPLVPCRAGSYHDPEPGLPPGLEFSHPVDQGSLRDARTSGIEPRRRKGRIGMRTRRRTQTRRISFSERSDDRIDEISRWRTEYRARFTPKRPLRSLRLRGSKKPSSLSMLFLVNGGTGQTYPSRARSKGCSRASANHRRNLAASAPSTRRWS